MSMQVTMCYLEGQPFRVEDLPEIKPLVETYEETNILKKGVAYRFVRKIDMGGEILVYRKLLPYRGIVSDKHFNPFDREIKVGLYYVRVKQDQYAFRVVRPRSKRENIEYSAKKEVDLVSATLNHEISPDMFFDNKLSQSDIGVDVYHPPVREEDDPLNMLMKLAIRLKDAPFEPYAARMKSLAVDKKSNAVEGSNIINNNRRGLRTNRAMSPSKYMQYCDIWQFDTAFIIRDIPGAMHSMGLPEGKMLVLYPGGIPFEINNDDLIDASDLIAQAIADTTEEAKEKRNHNSSGNKAPGTEKEADEEDGMTLQEEEDEE